MNARNMLDPASPVLGLALSPYHLTGPEPPAMLAGLLADRVYTLLPSPDGGRAGAERAAQDHPHYAELMRRWSWSVPLWESGVLCAAEELAEQVRRAGESIDSDDRLGALRPLMEAELLADEETYLQAVARDLLRGGPDPALSVPLAAGLDRYAAQTGLLCVRSEAVSVAQRAENQFQRRLTSFGIPMLTHAGGDRIAEARDELATELAQLRAALHDLCAHGEPDADLRRDLSDAARMYATAFEAARHDLLRVTDPDDPRTLWANATVTLVRLPADAVLRSSALAARAMSKTRAPTATATLPEPAEAEPDVFSLIVRLIGRPTA